MAIESALAFSICPQIVADEQTLTASTSLVTSCLAFGFGSRRVVIDRAARTVSIRRRTAWFYTRTQLIEFRRIAAATYGYQDLSPLAFLGGAHDAVDRFVVGLKLVGADEVRLFSFIGDGVFSNDGPLPDWWYWEDILMDFAGPQERESRIFVTLLSKLIGVTIAPSTLTPE
jgi:hypothetical protein